MDLVVPVREFRFSTKQRAPHWKLQVGQYLNDKVSQQWIGASSEANDSVIQTRSLRSSNLTESVTSCLYTIDPCNLRKKYDLWA